MPLQPQQCQPKLASSYMSIRARSSTATTGKVSSRMTEDMQSVIGGRGNAGDGARRQVHQQRFLSSNRENGNRRNIFGGNGNFIRRFGQRIKTGLSIVGAVAIVSAYVEYKRLNDTDNNTTSSRNDEPSKKKQQVLVIPFHRLKMVEKKDTSSSELLQSIASRGNKAGDDDDDLTLEVHELIDMIHQAAKDPNIVALYGIFGHGGTGISQLGWGNCEEIRNALRVFRESHRIHHNPNLHHEIQIIPKVISKPMYAYSDNFMSLMDSSNKEYYLASIFTDIHMQCHGELHLFGMIAQNIFIREFLQKYGIQVHVLKQAEYKNFPNMFTHSTYNQPHRDNVTNLLDSMNDEVCYDITASRSKALLTSWLSPKQAKPDSFSNKKYDRKHSTIITKNGNGMNSSNLTNTSINNSLHMVNWRMYQKDLWKRIQQSGTFPAYTAWHAGFVDYIPHRNPLYDLVENNKKSQTNKDDTTVDANNTIEASSSNNIGDNNNNGNGLLSSSSSVSSAWKLQETDFRKFKAKEILTMKNYMKQIEKKKKIKKRKEQWDQFAKQYPTIRPLLLQLGFLSPTAADKKKQPEEKIALLHVRGGIGDDMARKLVYSIQQIRRDDSIKCIVLRVSSPGGSIFACETIVQELQALKLPVVVSFGDVAASGGYYISSHADRIFANHKTITGSIGVFGIRMDLSGLAKQYGINVEHVTTSDLAGSYNSFYPMTQKMKQLMSEAIDRYYDQFKSIVADGRHMSLDAVQLLARGRVYTGNQAKTNGLVDELGGLHRAILYAHRNYITKKSDDDHDDDTAPIVVRYPKQSTFYERIKDIMNDDDNGKKNTAIQLWNVTYEYVIQTLFGKVDNSDSVVPYQCHPDFMTSGVVDSIVRSTIMSTAQDGSNSVNLMLQGNILLLSDENAAIQFLLNESLSKPQQQRMYIPNTFWN